MSNNKYAIAKSIGIYAATIVAAWFYADMATDYAWRKIESYFD